MRRVDALVLLSTLSQSTLVASKGVPRGVGPEFVKFYESKTSFACISNPSITIDSSRVNDNSCDCPDGSDEPGTAACSYLDALSPEQPLPGSVTGTTNTTNALPGFWCANKGHIGSYVPFAYVNDGVCDYELCCDGSEEFAHVGGVKCQNKCDSIGKEWRRVEEERRKSKERSASARRQLLKEAGDLRRIVQDRVTNLKRELEQLEVKKSELQIKFEEVERSEKGKVVKPEGQGGKLGVLLGLAKNRVKELRNTLDKVMDQRDDLADKVDQLEEILKNLKEEYNPNFNDEGVKAAVKAYEDYAASADGEKKSDITDGEILDILKEDGETSGVNWAEFEEEEGSDADIVYNLEAYLPEFAREWLHQKLNLARIWLIENGMLADNPVKPGGETRLVQAAREALESAKNDFTSKTASLEEQEKDLEKDYGPEGIFRALKGKCVSTEVGEYDYELCWMSQTTQKSRKGHGNTNMGNFVRIDKDIADEEERADGKGLGKGQRMVMKFENGQGCWNGPNRRTDVWLACAEKDELWRVSESEKCVYRMEVGTPAACEDVGEPGVKTKDEL
ncbi:glucosidase II beta subunit-like protein-domain-containing protein [Cercophora newfieldiana]|uniref:Glucosidase 2 subunit beta n=1 Tax=Cercophora newfieldiana TaxID=92897 RepID=A0AA39Y4A8_9PEZI|nr:glucosidase II beta subunit-like protein-domain-containing protein [Cercophora newfieldiana]